MSELTAPDAPCCDKPNIARLAFHQNVTNDICLHCKAHWYGLNDDVKRYTKAEWDALMEAAE